MGKTRILLIARMLTEGCFVAAACALAVGESSENARRAVNFPQISLSLLTGGLENPTHVNNAADGSGRLFIVEQVGRVRIIKENLLAGNAFLDISNRVLSGGERGLLSIAFPPNYAVKRYFYVYYTDLSGNVVIARYHLTADDDVADPGSEEVILTIPHPTFSNHNGGQLAFGPNDGFLYLGTGDGGGAGDPFNNAQNINILLGKLLRIDVESGMVPYRVPSDNPFVGTPGSRGEIWAYGLRNPWRFSFDRSGGDLYIADVGQDSFEEVDFRPSSSGGGENYGWNIFEGNHCFLAASCIPPPGYVPPVAEYDHTNGDCSVTGGFVYRGKGYPSMTGFYFYADFCTGNIRGLKMSGGTWQSSLLLNTQKNISTFGEDEVGNLYVASQNDGSIYLVTGSEIFPDVRVNGSDGPVSLSSGQRASVTVTLHPGSRLSTNADWWAAANTPSGILWFDGRSWTQRKVPGHQGPLFPAQFIQIANASGLPRGAYTVFFAVDLTMDGRLDKPLFLDSVEVTVN